MLNQLPWELSNSKLKLGEVHSLEPRGCTENLIPNFPEKSEKEVRICCFPFENLKFRNNAGTLLLCVEDAVQMEALNANA